MTVITVAPGRVGHNRPNRRMFFRLVSPAPRERVRNIPGRSVSSSLGDPDSVVRRVGAITDNSPGVGGGHETRNQGDQARGREGGDQ